MCNVTLPNVQALLSKARSAGVPIVYTRIPVRELQNRTGEAIITNDRGPDKFYGTVLDTWINDKQAKTVVIAGILTNGAVLYTAFAAALRGYTVIVATDATVSDSEYIQTYTLFQLLNQPGRSNAENKPLAANAVTLSTVALIQFGS
jgi:nicotinamidase-related amidase